MLPASVSEKLLSRGLLDVLIRAGLIAVLAVFCFQVFRPFLDLIVWSLILAITIYPLQRRMRGLLRNKDGRTATLIVIVLFGIVLVPTWLMGTAMLESVERAMHLVKEGSFSVPRPNEVVASWPLVGPAIYRVWQQAATDLSGLMAMHTTEIKAASLALLAVAAGLGRGLLVFMLALVIGGIVMAHGEAASHSATRIASRVFSRDRGPRIAALCTATIRAVALGVVGIAFIQMLLIGLGFVVKGIPGAGFLALAVLLLGIMQLPATLITIPVIAFVLITEGANVSTVTFSVYVFIAGLADNVLKPLLLGRGVDVPMPVILVGALGGMVTSGVIGLFIGPVVLAVGYQLFWQWVDDQPVLEAGS